MLKLMEMLFFKLMLKTLVCVMHVSISFFCKVICRLLQLFYHNDDEILQEQFLGALVGHHGTHDRHDGMTRFVLRRCSCFSYICATTTILFTDAVIKFRHVNVL